MDMMVIINQMIQLFLIMALGYFLNHMGLFDMQLNRKLTTFLLNVTTPAMIISSVLSADKSAGISMIIYVLLISIVVFSLLPLVGYIVAKVLRVQKQEMGLYIFMTVFSNIGFMGFPVMKSIFGNEAVFYTAIFNMTFNLYVFSIGKIMMNYGSGKKVNIHIKDMITPGVVSSFIALFLFILKIEIPVVLGNTLAMVGDTTTPLAMLLIGSTLATMPLKEVFLEWKLYPYTLLKQMIVPILSFFVLDFFIHDPLVLGVTFIVISMPVGNSAVLFSTEYGGDVKLAAKTVFITTLLSVITIPLMVYLFLI